MTFATNPDVSVLISIIFSDFHRKLLLRTVLYGNFVVYRLGFLSSGDLANYCPLGASLPSPALRLHRGPTEGGLRVHQRSNRAHSDITGIASGQSEDTESLYKLSYDPYLQITTNLFKLTRTKWFSRIKVLIFFRKQFKFVMLKFDFSRSYL